MKLQARRDRFMNAGRLSTDGVHQFGEPAVTGGDADLVWRERRWLQGEADQGFNAGLRAGKSARVRPRGESLAHHQCQIGSQARKLAIVLQVNPPCFQRCKQQLQHTGLRLRGKQLLQFEQRHARTTGQQISGV